MATKRALCIGINDYPGTSNDLNGCVNDATSWFKLLHSQGYQTTVLYDSEATREAVLDQLEQLVRVSRFGDRIVLTYSGHGSWVPDRDGDEADARDECLVLYDWQQSGYVTDDDLHAILSTRRFGVRATIFSDSCFSGTVARLATWNRPRYFPAELLTPGVDPDNPPPVRRDTVSRPSAVLFSGCTDLEYSYDAHINGMAQGAFTAAAMEAWGQLTLNPRARNTPTFREWHRAIRRVLPSQEYPQTPELQAQGWQNFWRL